MNNPNYPYAGTPMTKAIPMSRIMRLVYLQMCGGLVVTGLVAYFVALHTSFLQNVGSGVMLVLALAEIGLVIAISAGINKMSSTVATLLFYLFAIVNGLVLSSVFLVYTGTSIAKTFFITAATFGAMSVFGYVTRQDLSKMGALLFMALIGLIIASLVNIFLHSSGLEWIISIVGVLIFVGLTAWDTQQIKRMAEATPDSFVGRLAVLGALSLYLDFINLFLYLLRFFGSSRD